MRFTALALFVAALAVASPGCTRNVPVADDGNGTPAKPEAQLQKPVTRDSPSAVSLGEDENGKPVSAASIDAIRSALKDPDPGVRRSAVKSLGNVRWKLPNPVGTILVLALSDADAEVRVEAARIASVDPERADDVAKLLQDQNTRVRVVAASALIAAGKHEDDAYPVLMHVLGDAKAKERQSVLALMRAKAPASRPATPALVAIAQDPGDPLRAEAIGVLGQLGAAQAPVDALLLIAHDAEPKARAAALRALAQLDPKSAKVQVALVKAVRDANIGVKLAATEGVGSEGIPTLIELLRQNDESLRDAAARALGRIGPEAWTAGADLQRLAQSDPAERVRLAARNALKGIIPTPDFK
jgi:HEAT repeat protein